MKHLWIGLTEHCIYHAREVGFKGRPDIVQNEWSLQGLKGPATLHICGRYLNMKNYFRIRDVIRHLKTIDKTIKTVFHT